MSFFLRYQKNDILYMLDTTGIDCDKVMVNIGILSTDLKDKNTPSVSLQMNFKKSKYEISSTELQKKFDPFQFMYYFDYYTISFSYWKNNKEFKRENIKRVYKNSIQTDQKQKIIQFKGNQFSLIIWENFEGLKKQQLAIKVLNANIVKKMSDSNEGKYAIFLVDFPINTCDDNKLTIKYNYFQDKTQLFLNDIEKTVRFDFKDRESKFFVFYSEIHFRDSSKVCKMNEYLYSIILITPLVILELHKMEIDLVLFYNKNDQKMFSTMNQPNPILSMLFEIKEEEITKDVLLDSIKFLVKGGTVNLCIFNLERYIDKLDINANVLDLINNDY